MLRHSRPSLGVHNLWKVVDPLRISHAGGLAKLRTRYFTSNNESAPSSSSSSTCYTTPLRVGVDGNNVLHSLVRQTDLVKLLIHDDPEELCKACLVWAKKANSQILFGESRLASRNQGFSGFTPTPRNNNEMSSSSPQHHYNQSQGFQPSRQKDESSTIVSSFDPNNRNRSSLCSSSSTNFPSPQSIHRLLLHDRTTSGILFVFDGETPPSKIDLRKERYKRRERAIAEASVLVSYGEHTLANKILSQYPSILPKHLLAVSETLSRAGFPVLHAPFESEAQLSFLAEKGFINCVFSSDSDCLVFHPHSTVLRMRSSFEFDIYDLTKKSGMIAKTMSPFQESAGSNNNNNNQASNSSSSSSFQSLQQQRMMNAHRQLVSSHNQSLLNAFIHKTTREIFCFCCIASGSDYNAGAGESLPGNALAIFQRIVSRFPAVNGKRYGLDLEGALMDASPSNHQMPLIGNDNSNDNNKMETTRDACRRLHLPDDIALSLSRGVYSILQHLVYDPSNQRIVTFVEPRQVLDLRHFLQELLMKQRQRGGRSGFVVSGSSSSSCLSCELVDSEILGRRTPAIASVSDRDWCEGLEGVKYRAAMMSHHHLNEHLQQQQQTPNQHSLNGLLNSKLPCRSVDHQHRQQQRRLASSADSFLFRDEENGDFIHHNTQNRQQHVNNETSEEQSNQQQQTLQTTSSLFNSSHHEIDESPILVVGSDNLKGILGGFHCSACDATFHNLLELEVHLKGKRHEARSKIQKLINNNNNIQNTNQNAHH